MQLWFGNSYGELHGASLGFLATLQRHLAVKIEHDTKMGERFGGRFMHEGEWYGTLLHGNRFAAGLVPHVWSICQHYGEAIELRDTRERPPDGYPWHVVRARWRPYQDIIHKALLRRSRGVIDAPPRSGKTLMAARAIDSLALPSVYLAPSVPIVAQTYKEMVKWFGFNLVARLDGDARAEEKDISKPIVIATAASAVKQDPEWWKTRQLLIIDEFHHSAAETYHKINGLAEHIYYRYCFTGTHFRTGDDTMAMEAISSQVIHRLSVQELVTGGYLAPPRVVFSPVQGRGIASGDWKKVYRECIVNDEVRNQKIAWLANQLVANYTPTLVLVRWIKHARILNDMIPAAEMVKGGESALTSRTIEQFKKGNLLCLVGTTVIGEGVDIPNAAAEIYASSGNAGVNMMQSYFRPLTASPGKAQGYIYDFHDRHHSRLTAWSNSRMALAKEYLGEGAVVEL